jgi:hypothetical protein
VAADAAAARAAQAELIAEAIAAEAAAIAAEAAAGAAHSAAAAEESAGEAAELVKGWLSNSTAGSGTYSTSSSSSSASSSSSKLVSGPPVSVSWLLDGSDDFEALTQLTFMAAALGHPAIGPLSSSSSSTAVDDAKAAGMSDADADAFKDEFGVPNDEEPTGLSAGVTAADVVCSTDPKQQQQQQATLADVLDAASRQQMQAASQTALQQAQARVVALYRAHRTASSADSPSTPRAQQRKVVKASVPSGSSTAAAAAKATSSSSSLQQQLACQLGVSDVALAMALASFEGAEPSSPRRPANSSTATTVLSGSADPYASAAKAISTTSTPAAAAPAAADSFAVPVQVEGQAADADKDAHDPDFLPGPIRSRTAVIREQIEQAAAAAAAAQARSSTSTSTTASRTTAKAAPAAAPAHSNNTSSKNSSSSSKRIEVVFDSLEEEADSFDVAVQRMVLNTARVGRRSGGSRKTSSTPPAAAAPAPTAVRGKGEAVVPVQQTNGAAATAATGAGAAAKQASSSSKGATASAAPKGEVRIKIDQPDSKADSFDVAVQRMVATTAASKAVTTRTGSDSDSSSSGRSRSPSGPGKGFGVPRTPARVPQQQRSSNSRPPTPGRVGRVPQAVMTPVPWWERRAATVWAPAINSTPPPGSIWKSSKSPDLTPPGADAEAVAPARDAAAAAAPSPAESAAAAPTSIPVEWISTPTDEKRSQLKERAAAIRGRQQQAAAAGSAQAAQDRQLPIGWGSGAGSADSWVSVSSELTQELESELSGLLSSASGAGAPGRKDLSAPYTTPNITVSGAGGAPTKTQQLLQQQRQRAGQQRQAQQGGKGGPQRQQVVGRQGPRGFGGQQQQAKKSEKA